MGNLRKFKRKNTTSNKSELALTGKGQLIHDAIAMQYLDLLCEGHTLEAEQFTDFLVEQKDLIGLRAVDWVHRGAARLLGIDYDGLSQEQQNRFLIDNPDYVRKLMVEKKIRGYNPDMKTVEDRANQIQSEDGQKTLQWYYQQLANMQKD